MYALALNLLSTDAEYKLTLPIPTILPLIVPAPPTYIEEPPVKFNDELLPKFILESLTATALLKFTVPVVSNEPVITWSPWNTFEPVVAYVVSKKSFAFILLSNDWDNVYVSDAIEALNATLAAVEALKSVATDWEKVPPTDATLALKDAIW